MYFGTFLSQPVRFDRRGYAYESKLHLIGPSGALCNRVGDPASSYSVEQTERMLERGLYEPFACKTCIKKLLDSQRREAHN